jgi:hypothetical protein
VNDQTCRTTNNQQCRTINEQKCTTTNVQKCTNRKSKCTTTQESVCTTSNERSCREVQEEVCSAPPEKIETAVEEKKRGKTFLFSFETIEVHNLCGGTIITITKFYRKSRSRADTSLFNRFTIGTQLTMYNYAHFLPHLIWRISAPPPPSNAVDKCTKHSHILLRIYTLISALCNIIKNVHPQMALNTV